MPRGTPEVALWTGLTSKEKWSWNDLIVKPLDGMI